MPGSPLLSNRLQLKLRQECKDILKKKKKNNTTPPPNHLTLSNQQEPMRILSFPMTYLLLKKNLVL